MTSWFQMLYRSFQASLSRYSSLSTLNFTVQDAGNFDAESRPAMVEQDIIDSLVRTCPTLTCITLFSGTVWTQLGHV